MTLEILCAPTFPADESRALYAAAAALGITTEALIRRAVRIFAEECVPTQQEAETPTDGAALLADRVPTH